MFKSHQLQAMTLCQDIVSGLANFRLMLPNRTLL
jgi:hypothetical protein